MSSSFPLTGLALIDCAKANATAGTEIAAERCGYGDDIAAFQSALKSACTDIAVGDVNSVYDLITPQQRVVTQGGEEIAPESPSKL